MKKIHKIAESAATQNKGEMKAPRHYLSLYDKIKRQLEITRLVFGIISMLLYTAFTLIMLRRSWGSTIYLSIIMGLIGLYILLFIVLFVLQRKSRAKFSNSLKNYKSGLKILKSLLTLINFGLTVSVFIQAAGAKNIGTPFQVTVLIISLIWALFQIVYQTHRLIKRHKALKKKKSQTNTLRKQ